MNLQIVPLDCTVCEPWFIFSMAGLLGMIGVVVQSLRPKVNPTVIGIALLLVIALLGFRTEMRGLDWRNQYTLAAIDLQTSSDTNNSVATQAFKNNNYAKAQYYEYRSYTDYPSVISAYFLGQIEGTQGNYTKAVMYFKQVINNGPGQHYQGAYENLSVYLLDSGSIKENESIDQTALNVFPEDAELWTNYALLEKEYGDTDQAKYALSKVTEYGTVSSSLEAAIEYNQLITMNLSGGKTATI
jgi:tetratricopeptide (TPR) repeat protein